MISKFKEKLYRKVPSFIFTKLNGMTIGMSYNGNGKLNSPPKCKNEKVSFKLDRLSRIAKPLILIKQKKPSTNHTNDRLIVATTFCLTAYRRVLEFR